MAVAANVGRASGVEPVAEPAREAACALYERHGAGVFRFCLGRLRSREEAEDARQTTFLYALAALQRGVVPVAEASWLLKIADNVCKSRRHESSRRSRFEVVEDPQALQRVSAPAGAAIETLMPLDEALSRLTESQRQALLLREWRGLSSREIADELGTTPGSVDVLLLRARRALAAALEAPARPRRRLRSLDLASLAGAAKALFGGLAGKAAVAAIVAAVGASAGALALRERDSGEPAPRPAPVEKVEPAADRAPDGRDQVRADPVRRPPETGRPRVAPTPAGESGAGAAPALSTTEDGLSRSTTPDDGPAAMPRAADPVTAAASPSVEPLAPVVEPVTSTVAPVVGTVTSTVAPVLETVTSTVAPVVETTTSTAEPVVATVTETVEPVVGAVTEPLPPLPPVLP